MCICISNIDVQLTPRAGTVFFIELHPFHMPVCLQSSTGAYTTNPAAASIPKANEQINLETLWLNTL